MMNRQEKAEFASYCRGCTDAQLQGVLEKERAAGRQECINIVRQEMIARGIT